MEKLLSFFKIIKEQSPYYNMTFAVILFFILFLPVFIGVETLAKLPELTQWRTEFLPYITICFIIFFVFGGGQLIKKVVDYNRDKKAFEKHIKERQSLLSKLEQLSKEGKGQFGSKQACIEWGNKVGPLLKFSKVYYTIFMTNFNIIPLNLSSDMLGPAVDKMKSQVQMAIEELKNETRIT